MISKWIYKSFFVMDLKSKYPQDVQVTLNLKYNYNVCVQVWLSYDFRKEHTL